VLVIEAEHDIPGAAIVTGDFNAVPSSNVYRQVVS
jgi:endonuclease/exonuclease/phosphatase (EEP) superfamily protein YafD